MKKRIIFTVLMIILLTCVLSAHALAATVASGYCGDTSVNGGQNVTWTLDDSGTLTVSGIGDMKKLSSAPWYSYRSQITAVNISSGVTSIGYDAFYNCSSLTSINIPDSVTSIEGCAFYNCSNLTSITIPDSVTSIGSSAFYNCSSLTSINIPDSVTSIGNYMFEGCSSLASITIPDSVTSIGYGAFYGCSSLTSINIPDGVTSIGSYAFDDCKSLTNVTIGNSVINIGAKAFRNCNYLTSITIPDSVMSISEGAFYNTGWYDNQPDGIVYAGKVVYAYKGSMPENTHVTLREGTVGIGDYAFGDCSSLTSITIPDSVTSIGERAFYYCRSLTSINIPDSVTSIGNSAFVGSNRLSNVYITDLGAWCKITFGNADKDPFLYAHNFYLNGTEVEVLEIPDTVQVLKSNVFYGASCIKTVFIPKSVIGIAANAFAGCGGIEKVVYEGSEAEWNDIAISSGNEYLVNAPRFYNSTLSEYYFTVSCEICAGGTLSVDKNAFAPGETVTVTASPYSGYELTAIYVDGEILDGNTFPASKNHVVSAKFERLFGSDDCRIGDISVTGPDGNPCQTVPQGEFLATVPITNKTNIESVTVMLASYSSSGRFHGMAWLTFKNLPAGVTVDVTLPVDNTSGDVAELRAFVVDSLQSISPLGSAVSFGK